MTKTTLPRPSAHASGALSSFNLSNAPTTRNRALQAALADLPGYTAAVEHLNAAADFRAAVGATRERSADDAAAVVADLLRAGTSDVDTVVQAVADTVAASNARAAVHNAADVVVAGLAGELGILLDGGVDTLREHLHQQLQHLLRGAASLADVLDDDIDAATAIQTGREQLWRDAQRVVAAHRDLREAQRYLDVQTFSNGLPPAYETLRTVRDPLSLHPEYPHWFAGLGILEGGASRAPSTPPWPDTDTPAFLAWAVRHAEKTWIPTGRQLAQSSGALDGAIIRARSEATTYVDSARRRDLAEHRHLHRAGQAHNLGATDTLGFMGVTQ